MTTPPKNVQICLSVTDHQISCIDQLLEAYSLKTQKVSGVYVKIKRTDWIRSLIDRELEEGGK